MKDAILKLENVSFFADGKHILEDISLQIKEGEKVLFSGPSGSGKSTLLKLIGSVISPSQGKIYYQGNDIESINPYDYRKEVSYFFQNAALFDQKVEDNLSFPAQIRGEELDMTRAEFLLEEVGLSRSYLAKSINDLSGGEKQRIALVRNLMYQPKVILLDEVTSSLDQANRDVINQLIDKLIVENGITVLAVTHNQKDMEEASRLIKIEAGKVVEESDE